MAFGTYFGNYNMSVIYDMHGPRWSLIPLIVAFIINMISVMTYNTFDKYNNWAFLVAFFVGVYDGAFANYIWRVIHSEFD